MAGVMRFVPLDPYVLALMATVGGASLFPAQGAWAEGAAVAVTGAIFLLFFLYGARLAPREVGRGMAHWRLQLLVLLCTYGVFPLLGLGIAALGLGLAPPLVLGFLYLCVLPSTVQSSIAFTGIAGGNVPAALTAATVSNLLGVVATPVLVGLLMGGPGGGFSLDALEDIALQVLLPFALGQLARPVLAGWVARHRRVTSMVDRGAILLVVYVAFSEGMTSGVWSLMSGWDFLLVMALDCVVLALVMAASLGLGSWAGFSRADRLTLFFCGSKKSMATGLPMAGVLFAGQAVPLIVLPLMLFHQIQLLVCAALAQHWARTRPLADDANPR
ncbi:bile acid:sodium symporter family protein [Pararhodospirillum oryzae]|uniref:Bile acid:sodium symporter n=1 Tax=Pararhodospirillum oryzae TaxID=478448 RepID=A0A512H827_9PROT|nr:bile acid:sodium symporter family protein [Pararhodospirillum oryzae]GEO81602.1 bile acid:sodium symporter [Pararhodospirillum oryzae]